MNADFKSPLYVVLFTALVSTLFTAAIMILQVATAGQVLRNQELREERAIVEVFGLGAAETMTGEEIEDVVRRRIDRSIPLQDPQTGWTFPLIRAYGTDGVPGEKRSDADLIGVAIPVSGMGFWATITGLMALKPDFSEVLGVVFLDQRETPGLGGRIMEKEWRDQFKKLEVSSPAPGGKFLYIGGGQPSGQNDPRFGRSVDAITGATQTCLAVERLINESLRRFHRTVKTRNPEDGKGE